jgi:hypothetical protein
LTATPRAAQRARVRASSASSPTLIALCCFGFVACDDTPVTTADAAVPRADASGDAGVGADAVPGPDVATSSSCAQLRVQGLSFDSLDDVSIRYTGAVEPGVGTALRDRLLFDVLRRQDFPTSTGTFALGTGFNGNFATCTHCPLLLEDLLPDAPARAVYFPEAGEVTLDVDPFSLSLEARFRGLRMVEVTIGGEFLESTPVPGGRCVDVADFDVDYRFVPMAWTCGDARFNDGATCDCGCGAADLDCYPGIPATVGCTEQQACVEDRCIDRCSAFAPESRCASGFCSFSEWGDLCSDDTSRVDPAPLGGTCASLDALYCGLEGGLPRGLCDGFARADQVCKPVCRTDADCAGGDRLSCLTVATERGFCEQAFPPGWTCGAAQWQEGLACDCGCGVPDTVDCQSDLPVAGCGPSQGCSLAGACVPQPPNDLCTDAQLISTSTTVRGTTEGAGHELAVGPGAGRCLEGDQQGPEVYYRVELAAGQVLELELRSAHDGALYLLGPGQPSAACLQPVEQCVTGHDDVRAGMPERASYTATRAGTYTVVVDSFWHGEQGAFELDVRLR